MSEDPMTSARPQVDVDQPVFELPESGTGQASPPGTLEPPAGGAPTDGGEDRPTPEAGEWTPAFPASGDRACLHSNHIIDKPLENGEVVFVCADCHVQLDLEVRR